MTRPKGNIGKHVVHSSAWLYGRQLVTNMFHELVKQGRHPGSAAFQLVSAHRLMFVRTGAHEW